MPRITNADLDRLFESYARQAPTRPGYRLGLDYGSKTYGRAFRLFEINTDKTQPGWSGHYAPLIGSDYLGMTKAEAFETLSTMRRVLVDLTDYNNGHRDS